MAADLDARLARETAERLLRGIGPETNNVIKCDTLAIERLARAFIALHAEAERLREKAAAPGYRQALEMIAGDNEQSGAGHSILADGKGTHAPDCFRCIARAALEGGAP